MPASYSLNRALLLRSHGKDDPAGGEPGEVTGGPTVHRTGRRA